MKRFVVAGVILMTLVLAIAALGPATGVFLSPQDPLKKADAIVAISGGETDSRARMAIQLYHDHYAPKIIFSGAALDRLGPSNAVAMERTALADGIDPADIILDETATNTSQNAEAVAKIAQDNGYHSIILVTSPYHQRRASISFSRALDPDIKIINHSSIDMNWRRSRWWINPSAYPITLLELQKTSFLLVTGSK